MKLKDLHLVIVTQEFLDKMESNMSEMMSMIKTLQESKTEAEIRNDWIESVQVPKLLGISQKTWQTYRDKRLISYTQIGSKIYVKRSDLNEFMESHTIHAIRQRSI